MKEYWLYENNLNPEHKYISDKKEEMHMSVISTETRLISYDAFEVEKKKNAKLLEIVNKLKDIKSIQEHMAEYMIFLDNEGEST